MDQNRRIDNERLSDLLVCQRSVDDLEFVNVDMACDQAINDAAVHCCSDVIESLLSMVSFVLTRIKVSTSGFIGGTTALSGHPSRALAL
jgi:hypothetical protein